MRLTTTRPVTRSDAKKEGRGPPFFNYQEFMTGNTEQNAKQRSYVVIWGEPLQVGSHCHTLPRWRPIISYLSPQQIYREQMDQFGDVVDIVEVTNPLDIKSVLIET